MIDYVLFVTKTCIRERNIEQPFHLLSANKYDTKYICEMLSWQHCFRSQGYVMGWSFYCIVSKKCFVKLKSPWEELCLGTSTQMETATRRIKSIILYRCRSSSLYPCDGFLRNASHSHPSLETGQAKCLGDRYWVFRQFSQYL